MSIAVHNEDPRSVAEVVKDILGNLQEIIRSEIRLAQIEVREEVSKAARGGILIALGAVFGLVAFGFLLWGLVYLLATIVALWLAAVIAAAAAAALAATLISVGRAQMKRVELPPRKTLTTLRENIQWAKRSS